MNASLFTSNNLANLGSINLKVQPLFSVPPLPNIIAEWSALIPLVCHLASYRQNHVLAGEIALNGRISIGLCPRLGVLAGVANFLRRGSDFIDNVSAKGGEGKRVWDVNWGSVFPCANGAASAFLADYALSEVGMVIEMPKTPSFAKKSDHSSMTNEEAQGELSKDERSDRSSKLGVSGDPHAEIWQQREKVCSPTLTSTSDPTHKGGLQKPNIPEQKQSMHRRYQTLHVLDFSRTIKKPSWRGTMNTFLTSATFEAITFVGLIGLVLALCLVGSYGTASVLFCSSISRLSCRLMPSQHPPAYLINNEAHDACMLVGIHQNASVWYLYVGDRGAVDWLLNKTMISFPHRGKKLSRWFRFAHVLQLLGMTFTAAQRGWDGVCLLVLILVDWILRWRFQAGHIARRWLETVNLTVRAKTFEFTGRTPMLGAIQQWNGGSTTLWMDEIIVPCPRREAWLASLTGSSAGGNRASLSAFDQRWVDQNLSLSLQAGELFRSEIEVLRRERGSC